MKSQTIFGTLFVGIGAALVGFVFGPIIKQALYSPDQRGERMPYRQGSMEPHRQFVQHASQPQRQHVVGQLPPPVQGYAPPNQFSPQVSALPTLAPPPAHRVVQQTQPNPVRRSLPLVADHNSVGQPVWNASAPQRVPQQIPQQVVAQQSPQQIPQQLPQQVPQQLPEQVPQDVTQQVTQQLPKLELPELELELESPELEAPVVNWQEDLPQVADSQPHDSYSTREQPELRRLPSHQVPTVRGVARYESTEEPIAKASRIPQRATQAVRIQDAGYEQRERFRQRGHYEPETVEQMSYTPTSTSALEMSSIRESKQIQIAPQTMKPVAGRSVQGSSLKRLRVSPQIESRVAKHLKYGESLTRRRSFLAAREEFTVALLLIAESHKTASNPQAYADCLARGFTALDEAKDFAQLKREGSSAALTQRIMSHKTGLIPPHEIETINPTRALDLYCGFAQSQIEKAIGYSVGGSQALHAMGKLENLTPQSATGTNWTRQSRALVFFRAAMSVDPNNSVCSNDLGVLLYDLGRLREAEEAFKVSLGKSQSKLGWENLAMVHSQMASAASGEERNRQTWLANLASKEAQNFADGHIVSPVSDRWASAAEFENRAAFPSPVNSPTTTQQRSVAPVEVQRSAASSLLQKVKGWY